MLTALSLPAASGALEEKHRSVQQIEIAPRIEAKHPRLDSTLARLAQTTRARGRTVEIEAVARGARRGELEAAIRAAGGSASGRYGRLLEARLPVRALETLAAHPAARFLRTPIRPQPQAVTGQGIAASGAAAWQSAGWTGARVKIAVVDVGFRGWRVLQPPQGDLPASVFTADFCPAGRFEGPAADNHGAAIAEVVHELAPAAELHLVCIDSVTSLGQAKDYALSHDIPIVNHSVGWLNAGSGDGSGGPETPDGIVADARAQGVLWVNSAGNYGQTHWSGTFSDPDANGFHDFDNLLGGDEGNEVFLLGGGCVFLKWDDWPASDQDFDLYLFRTPNDGSPDELVALSDDRQDGLQEPVETVCTDFLGGDHYVAIEKHEATATPPPRFDLFVTNGDFLEHKVSAGSLVEPAGSPSALAAGALCWEPGSFVVPGYSSRGPTLDGRIKPDLLGYDGVSSATYGLSSDCDTSEFLGTSPAAAHVSGAAALLLQANPGLGPAELQSALETRAADLAPAGKDNDSGSGKLKLGAAPPPPPANHPPSATPQSVTTDEDTTRLITLAGSDLDGDPLAFTLTSLPAHGTLYRGDSTAPADAIAAVPAPLTGSQLTHKPHANVNGSDGFSFSASDGGATSAPASVSLTVAAVNDAPLALDDTATTAEDTAKEITAASLLTNDTDVDGDDLAVSTVSAPVHGQVTLAAGLVIFTPEANYHGPAGFAYAVSDGHGGSDSGAVALTITPVNDAPVCSDLTLTTNEDAPASVAPSCSDADSTSLTYAIEAQGTKGVATVVEGQLRYTPAADASGADSFSYRASDGSTTSGAASVAVTITAVNEAPVCADRALSTDEDTTASVAPSCSDVDSATLTYAIVTQGTKGSVAVADGQLHYTPDPNANGADSFRYRASDGSATSDTAAVTVTIAAVNDAPSVTAQAVTINEDTAKLVMLAGSDPDGDPLTLKITSLPAHGTIHRGSSTSPAGRIALPAALTGNQVTYEPDADYAGADSFAFTANDGTLESAAAAVSISVAAVNDAPLAVNDTATTAEDTAAITDASALVANDHDVEGDTLTLTGVSAPLHGHVTVHDGVVTFTPEPNYHGLAGFQYAVSDGQGGSDSGHVSLTVSPVNDAPVAVDDDAGQTAEDTAKQIAAASLTGNDTDVDGDLLTISAVGPAANGTVTLNAGQITFTPAPDYHGPAGFGYTLADGQGGSDTGAVIVTVTQVPGGVLPPPPVISVPPPPVISVPPPLAISVPPPPRPDDPVQTDQPQTGAFVFLAFTRSPATPQAGRRFTLIVRIASRVTSARGATRRVSCSARIGRRTLRPAAKSVGGGIGRCSWAIPRNATGKRLASSIAIREGSQSIRKSFSAEVRRAPQRGWS